MPSTSGPKPSLLSLNDVHQFKLLGGFNDDWDCCYGLLIYLTTLPVKKRTMAHLKQVMDIRGFAKKHKIRPMRVSGLVALLGRPQSVKIEKIARIFQEVYLGGSLYKTIYRKPAYYWKKRGLIQREKLIYRRSTLDKLKKMGLNLGIATGRSRFEASYALKRFEIHDYFDTMTTIDDVKKAEQLMKQSLRKPHPYSLLETAKKLGEEKRFAYIGDLPDDLIAAHEAGKSVSMKSVAFPWFHLSVSGKANMDDILQAHPDFILKKATDLPYLAARGKVPNS